MADIAFTITDAGRAAIVAAGTNGTLPVHIVSCGVTATAVVPSKTATSLPDEIKRITTVAGTAASGDTIHLTVQDASSDTYDVKSLALYLADGTLFAIYGQATSILSKSASAILLLAADVRFASIDATSIAFGNTDFINPPATETTQGVVELATDADAVAMVDRLKALTPAGLGKVFTAAKILSQLITVDGSGSGLDADMLDGREGAWYADIASRLGYTPANRAGDTFSGAIRRTSSFYLDLLSGTKPLINLGNSQYILLDPDTGSLIFSGVDIRRAGNLIWDSGNDGAGSGLDADLFDGLESAAFAKLSGAAFSGPISRTAAFYLDLLSGNKPLINMGASQYIVLDAAELIFNGMNLQRAGSRIWDAGNDGSGSGLDADLLDGLDSTAFLKKTDNATLGSTANGLWEKRANGLLDQWGVVTIPATASPSASIAVTFPVPFPTECWGVTTTARGSAQPIETGWGPVITTSPDEQLTSTGCSIYLDTTDPSKNITKPVRIFWRAIGH